MSKKKINLRELDINNIGGWPREAQIGFCVGLALLIVALVIDLVKKGDAEGEPRKRTRPRRSER